MAAAGTRAVSALPPTHLPTSRCPTPLPSHLPAIPTLQAHEHAAELVLQFGRLEMSVAFLVQIDKLVQLFESPILTHVRLQLLEPETHPYLLKALWGVLMLLPQSPAYHTLKNRLSCVPELGLLRLHLAQNPPKGGSGASGSQGGSGMGSIDFKALQKTYEEVQAKHQRLQLQKTKNATQRLER